jgi:hypothetical protein
MKYERKKIKGFAQYEIDTVGNVFTTKISHRLKSKDGKLAVRINSTGYHQAALYSDKKRHQVLVHRLVWEAFNGPIPKDMQIDHIDNNKTNNLLSNLQLLTASDNIKKMWDRRGRSEKKEIVKDWLARGYSRKFISDNLDVSEPYISMIANGKR